jgi:hypothetical protein
MSRPTAAVAAVVIAAVASSTVAAIGPARAEAVVYETQNVKAEKAGEYLEYAAIDIPTGYVRDRVNWHRVAWHERHENGRTIILDLHPRADTVAELAAERATLRAQAGSSYEELAYVVNGDEARVSARWVFTYTEPGTGDVAPFVSVILLRGNRLQVVGRLDEKEPVKRIRRHIVHHLVFPS